MNENDVTKIVRDHINSQFPKACHCCGKRFNSLADYLKNTSHVGLPSSADAERGDWQPKKPIGTFSMANCACGSTLSISSTGMEQTTLLKLMAWARKETQLRGISLAQLLEDLRDKIDKRVFQEDRQ